MSVSVLDQETFKTNVTSRYTDVIAKKVGGKVLAFSDEWFADATNLIEATVPIRDATRFTEKGAWYDGWETRRHNTEEADWVIFKLGVASAQLVAAEVDTAFFNGNHAPHISVEAASLPSDFDDSIISQTSEKATGSFAGPESIQWDPILPKLECGPSAKFFFARDEITTKAYTHARLRMYPDGGIARFRLYGKVVPVVPQEQSIPLDTAAVENGGVAVSYSDQHFGTASNLLLPGRGHDMSDGWETKRSRSPGHVDWVVVKLGFATKISKVVIDTAHYKGNFPQSVIVKGINKLGQEKVDYEKDVGWKVVVPQSKTGPHKEHFYTKEDGQLENVDNGEVYTHVSLTIIPDGGVKRLRIFGTRA